jgi:hypothetical protein
MGRVPIFPSGWDVNIVAGSDVRISGTCLILLPEFGRKSDGQENRLDPTRTSQIMLYKPE